MDNIYIDIKENLFFYDYNKWLINKNELKTIYENYYKKVIEMENDLINHTEYLYLYGKLNYINYDINYLVYNALLSKKDYELLLQDLFKRNLYLSEKLKNKKFSFVEFFKEIDIGIDVDKLKTLTLEKKKNLFKYI
jgi:hypothetical protein